MTFGEDQTMPRPGHAREVGYLGVAGVRTIITGQAGRVEETDLGPKTLNICPPSAADANSFFHEASRKASECVAMRVRLQSRLSRLWEKTVLSDWRRSWLVVRFIADGGCNRSFAILQNFQDQQNRQPDNDGPQGTGLIR